MDKKIFTAGDQLTIQITSDVINKDGKRIYQLSGSEVFVTEEMLKTLWEHEPKTIEAYESGFRKGKLDAYVKMTAKLADTLSDEIDDTGKVNGN